MSKIILSMDTMVLKEIPLTKERITIGRKPHNDIQIDNLAISGEHAVVVTILNDSFLEDLESTNGTFVNGQAVKKHFLQNGDVIELGKYRLKYVNEAAPQTATPDFEKTMVLRPDMLRKTADQIENKGLGDTQVGLKTAVHAAVPPPTQAGGVPPAAPAATPPQLAAIQILSGANAGKEMDLTKTLTTLGKPGVQVAVIARRPHGYFITHVEGAQFPVVDGITLEANKPHQLKDHDIVELAGIKMEFFFKV
ncbi:MAG: FHA domain-containing protein [Rhodocyclales bacterium]|nr:FHA domain-containing protein [Rhodocyclales bacterium]